MAAEKFDLIGRTVSHYEVVAKLGEGGMGQVYRAVDRRLGRNVALKMLPAARTFDANSKARFFREAQAASALNHPNIITIHDILCEGGMDVIVMECVEGRTLHELIPPEGMEPATVVEIAIQLGEALTAAHEAGIVHRDLKPGNVMVRESGQVKVLDFGLAKAGRPADGDPSATLPAPLTRQGALLGTVDYMSPEQALTADVDHRSDIFSLGVIAYEMLAGKRPFEAASAAALLHKIAYEAPSDLRARRGDVPAALHRFLETAMAKSPDERFQSAGGLVAALRAVESAGDPASRRPGEDIAAMPTLSLPAGGARSGAPRPRRTISRALILVAVAAGLLVAALSLAPSLRRGLLGPWLDADGPREGAAAAVDAGAGTLDYYQLGATLLERYDKTGNVDRAIAAFERAISEDAANAAAYAGQAQAQWRKYRDVKQAEWLDRALASARRATELDDLLAVGHLSLGLIHTEAGRFAEARAELDRALFLNPLSSEVYEGLGWLEDRQGRSQEAERLFNKAVELDPGNWRAHNLLASLRFRLARYGDAEASYRRTLALTPDNFYAHRNLAATYHMLGRYEEAAGELQRALELKPDASVYSNLGTLHFFRGLYAEAVVAFEKAVELGANDFRIWSNLADAYRWSPADKRKAGKAYTRTIDLLEQALARDPASADLRSRKVLALAKAGRMAEAFDLIDEIQVAGVEDPAVLFRLTVASEVGKDREQALATLGRVLASGYSLEEIRREPELAELRADERFGRLIVASQTSQTTTG